MSEFQTALDLVHSTLREMRDQGVELRASAESLAQLASVPVAPEPPVVSRKEPEPVPAREVVRTEVGGRAPAKATPDAHGDARSTSRASVAID